MVSGSSSTAARGGDTAPRVFTYTELFEQCCPIYMARGMTYAEFWDGDCEMVKAFRVLDEIEQERRNEFAWQQGLYIYEAIAAAFSKKAKYPDKPHPLKTSVSKEREKREQEQNERKVVDYMMTFMNSFNKRFAGKQKEGSVDVCRTELPKSGALSSK